VIVKTDPPEADAALPKPRKEDPTTNTAFRQLD
jgi:hypothetical protein